MPVETFVPQEFDHVEAQFLSVDEGQRELGGTVEADLVTAFPQEVAGEEKAVDVGENVDQLKFDHDALPDLFAQGLVELQKIR